MIRDVVLVPGLWMPSVAMLLFGARLSSRGYSPRVFVYPGRGSFDAAVDGLAAFAERQLGARPAHFLGHSLGGVVILQALCRHRELHAASSVLLGAPVRGCLAGRRLARSRMGRWMLGGSAPCWAECEARWPRPEPLGVIAGTVPFGLGRALGALPGENDGVVRVDETAVQGMTQRVLVRQGHSMLIASAAVAALTTRFFAQGSFD